MPSKDSHQFSVTSYEDEARQTWGIVLDEWPYANFLFCRWEVWKGGGMVSRMTKQNKHAVSNKTLISS